MYKILVLPLRIFSFFKYGVPYAYMRRTTKTKNNTEYYIYEIIWYFNCKDPKSKNSLNIHKKNSTRYLGNKLSLKVSWKQLYKYHFKK